MAGLFSRIKVWTGLDVVSNTDLNAEFDNIIQNLGPSGMSGWSSTVAQMQIQTSPGSYGAESLATSTNGEIERLRYQLNAIIGGPDGVWYDQPSLSLSQVSGALNTPPLKNRIVSGATNGTSLMPLFLVPAGGSTKTVTLQASSGTPFICVINGTTYTFTSNITSGTLALAPASNNTALVNDATNADGSNKTKGFGAIIQDLAALADGTVRPYGEYPINCDTVGSGITALVGTYQAFSYVHSASTEYFIGYVLPGAASTATQLTKCFRGYFYNSSSAPIPAIGMYDDDTITLMQLVWIYVTTTGSLLAVYTNPIYSAVQPSSSASGDMWYDTINQTWKQSNGSTYSVANATLVGVAMTNGSGCVAARSFDTYRGYSNASNIHPEWYSSSEYRTKYANNVISVYGNTLSFDKDSVRWTSGTTETSSVLTSATTGTTVYNYLSETGTPYISSYAPLRRYDLGGLYHPYNSWRCCGMFLYGASGVFDSAAYMNLVNLNGEFMNDKSISVAKLKPSPSINYNPATSGIIGGYDDVSVSNAIYYSPIASPSLTQFLDSTSAAIQCYKNCTGRPILIGFTQSFILKPTGGGTDNPYNSGISISYYVDGSSYFSTSAGINCNGLSGATSNYFYYSQGSLMSILFGVTPGQHYFTVYGTIAGTSGELQGGVNAALFVKEL